MHVRERDQIKHRSVPTDLPACRFCSAPLRHTFVDLGMSPLCESYVPARAARRDGALLPAPRPGLRAAACWCSSRSSSPPRRSSPSTPTSRPTRTPGSRTRATTSTRWSSASDSDADSLVVEVASNDGYLLQHVVERGIPALGIEPAANVAEAAARAGRRDDRRVLRPRARGTSWCAEGRRADLLVANNVLAHVPDLNDFVAGMQLLLAPGGVVTIEFPHLLRLIERATSSTRSTTSTSPISRS